jgi:putative endonuclease
MKSHSTTNQRLGRWGEGVAADYLTSHGYLILERNARTPYGEIDIVAQLSSSNAPLTPQVVFVEVKTRSTTTFGPPEISITRRKQEHMLAAAQYYLQQHPQLSGDWRIDVLAIEQPRQDQPPVITHFENVMQ